MLEAIYTGPEIGSGGGGGSTNPTTGVVPVNQFGIFQDSNISSDSPSLGNTTLDLDDANSRISAVSNSARVDLDGNVDSVTITGADVDLYGDVNVHNHLGLPLLKFVGGTALFPALKRVGAELEVRLANDSAYANITASNVTATNDVITSRAFITVAKSILESITNANFTLYNAAKNAFSLLQFGGVTNLFPALKRNATELQVRLADDSGPAPLRSGTFTVDGASNGISFANNVMNIYAGVTVGNSIIYGNLNGCSIGKGNSLNVASSILELVSTSKGFLPPRMTDAQRLAIAAPAQGLIVYQTNTNGAILEGLYIYKSTGWTFII